MGLLLTGASGYIGSRVAAALDRDGIAWQPLRGRLEDLDPGTLAADVVIHCAGALRSRPAQLASANTLGTARLAAALRDPARIVFLSTRSVYPLNGHAVVDERVPPAPFDEYGRTKLAAEEALRRSRHQVVLLRVCGVFGHPERNGVFLDRAVDLALAGEAVPVASPDRLEDHVAVDWLADAVIRAAHTPDTRGRVLNVAGPARSLDGTLAALGRAVSAVTGRRMRSVPTPLPVPATPLLDAGRATDLLGLPPHPSDDDVFRVLVSARSDRTADAQGRSGRTLRNLRPGR